MGNRLKPNIPPLTPDERAALLRAVSVPSERESVPIGFDPDATEWQQAPAQPIAELTLWQEADGSVVFTVDGSGVAFSHMIASSETSGMIADALLRQFVRSGIRLDRARVVAQIEAMRDRLGVHERLALLEAEVAELRAEVLRVRRNEPGLRVEWPVPDQTADSLRSVSAYRGDLYHDGGPTLITHATKGGSTA